MVRKDADIYLTPTSSHINTLIWLHGLGDSAEGFLDVFNEEAVNPVTNDTKVVLLTAESRSVTINAGMIMPSWYDMKVLSADINSKLTLEQRISVPEIKDSYDRITEVVSEEVKNLKGKLIVGGFSQGCVMALYVGLENPHVKGIFGFSGYLTSLTKLTNLGKIPIHLFHGEEDDMIPCEAFAKKTYEPLLREGKANLYTERMLGHGLNMKQLAHFKKLYRDIVK